MVCFWEEIDRIYFESILRTTGKFLAETKFKSSDNDGVSNYLCAFGKI